MQPHSMCAVGLSSYIFNHDYKAAPKSCKARVDYTNHQGLSAILYYDLYDIRLNEALTEARITIRRTSGGFSCTVTARRSGTSEGAKVTIKHDTIHASGVYEEFKLWNSRITSGDNVNSARYGTFKGEIQSSDPRRVTLNCEVKRLVDKTTSRYDMVTSRYDLELSGL